MSKNTFFNEFSLKLSANINLIEKWLNTTFNNSNFLIFIVIIFVLIFIVFLIKLINGIFTNKLKIFSQDIKKEIADSVQSKFIKILPEAEILTQLAIDHWRLNKKIVDISKSLTEKEKQSLNFSLDRIKHHISRFDIEVKDYTNEKYFDGLNVEVISVEKHKHPSKESIIKDTIDPGVTVKGLLVKKAKVIVLAE